jgi:hypothetical protein
MFSYYFLPPPNTVWGLIYYSLLGYLLILLTGYCATPRAFNIEDYRRRMIEEREARARKARKEK